MQCNVSVHKAIMWLLNGFWFFSTCCLCFCHRSWQTGSPSITRLQTISITFNNSMCGVCHMRRREVGLGRAYIDMFVKLRFECRGESAVYRSLANSTNNGGSKCLCLFQLVCGVFLLNLTKLGKHFYPQCRRQNFTDKAPLSQRRHINLQQWNIHTGSCLVHFAFPFIF